MSTNRVQNTLGYSPVLGGLRFLPLFLVSFAVPLLTGRLIGKVAMGVLLGVAAAGPASMAHLPATSTWLVLLPGLVLAGIGLGVTSTALASAALAAVEPARAGMAAGLTNTMHLVGTATGVAVLGALYASRVNNATLHALAGLPAVPPDAVHRLAAAVASGAGTRVPGYPTWSRPPPLPRSPTLGPPADSMTSCSPRPRSPRWARWLPSPSAPTQPDSHRPAPPLHSCSFRAGN
jgi:hypothetical protein